jgi:hypothetical protein
LTEIHLRFAVPIPIPMTRIGAGGAGHAPSSQGPRGLPAFDPASVRSSSISCDRRVTRCDAGPCGTGRAEPVHRHGHHLLVSSGSEVHLPVQRAPQPASTQDTAQREIRAEQLNASRASSGARRGPGPAADARHGHDDVHSSQLHRDARNGRAVGRPRRCVPPPKHVHGARTAELTEIYIHTLGFFRAGILDCEHGTGTARPCWG